MFAFLAGLKGAWSWIKAIAPIVCFIAVFCGIIYIVKKLEEGAVAQANYERVQAEQLDYMKLISAQNRELKNQMDLVVINTATIGQFSSRLDRLSSTVTPDIDPTPFQQQLQEVINNQYACMERITQGSSNATCS